MAAPTEQENSFTARKRGPTWPEDHKLYDAYMCLSRVIGYGPCVQKVMLVGSS